MQVQYTGQIVRRKNILRLAYDKRSPNTPLRLNVLEGEQTSLPCPIKTATHEAISAVWFHVATHAYKEHGSSPHYISGHLQAKRVYAIEAPEPSATALGGTTGLVDGMHWKRPSWSGRAFFSLLSDPPALRLNRLERSDSGNYDCNVTYRDNVTSDVAVVTESRVELFVAGDHDVTLTWYQNGTQLRTGPGNGGDNRGWLEESSHCGPPESP
ncbi:hypothetical protein HPB49_017678 [Dermacentor silvarum]|uniref:Uncharacterized protein n=1 Tax=Dermacentor silvarum TaxID=543639 RepID=A0ACB8DQD6_DERSI|nr:hypothetical protein HPB49_017678 [Dermacentor silvarum]